MKKINKIHWINKNYNIMLKKCSKCQEGFECKESNACWCNRIEHISIIIIIIEEQIVFVKIVF